MSLHAATDDSNRDRLMRSFRALGYPVDSLLAVPDDLLRRSHPSGCPVASVRPSTGDTVLDIGSGHGFDCVLLKSRAPAHVRVIGLDPWSRPAGDVAFVTADGASLPIASESADWVMAHGVLCVVPDPERVIEEAFRVLKPGGRLSLGLLTASLPLPLRWLARWLADIRSERGENAYRAMVRQAGFVDLSVTARHRYDVEMASDLWGTRASTRFLLRRGRQSWARPLAKRLLARFHGVDLSAVKPDREAATRPRFSGSGRI